MPSPAARSASSARCRPIPSAAAGPTQVLVAANGRLRTYGKSSSVPDGVINVTTNAFFGSVRGAGGTYSPRVRYDRLSGRWFVLMMTDALPGRLVLATSSGPILTAGAAWSFFAFDNTFTGTGCAFDSPTLGIDVFALYVGVNQFCDNGATYAGTSAFVVRSRCWRRGPPSSRRSTTSPARLRAPVRSPRSASTTTIPPPRPATSSGSTMPPSARSSSDGSRRLAARRSCRGT